MVFNLLIIIAGLAAILGVEVRELPDVDRPVVSVRATFPGAAPETVDAEVTSVLEGAVARVPGVRDINSSSEENNARIRVEFNPGVNLDTAAADVREAVAQVERRLPDRVEQVNVVKADDDSDPIVRLAIFSDVYDEQELTRIIEKDILPEYLSIEGVASVDQFGTRERQLRVVVDPLRLSRFGLTMGDVVNALRQAPFDVPVGSFLSEDQQLLVRAEATAATPERVKEVVISEDVRIEDVAEAFFAPADASSFVRYNGNPIVGLGIIRQARSNTINISDSVANKTRELNERFDDLAIEVTSDEAQFIRVSVSEVLVTLLIAVGIVVVTILVFFGAFKAALIPATAIPTALIGAVAGIWLLGFSVNLLTLLALVLATGLIVDDAIVVLENIQRWQMNGVGRKAAAARGTKQVFFAVVATTAVLVAVFAPISFLPSTAGRLFREFGFVLAVAVIISSFVALTLVPALAAGLDLRSERRGVPVLSRIGRWLAVGYRGILHVVVRVPLLTTLLCMGLAGGAVAVVYSLDQELVPTEDRGVVYVFATGPDGVGLEYMQRQADHIDRVMRPLVDSGEVVSLYSVVGQWDPNRVFVTATLAPWEERVRSQEDIINSLRGPLNDIPGARISVFGRGSLDVGRGRRSGIEAALVGAEYDDIYEGARALAAAIDNESEILSNAEISYQPTQPQLSIKVDRRRAADLGVSLDELSLTLRTMVGGDEIVDLNVADQAIPIFLESQTGAITDPSDLRNLYVRSSSGELIALSSLTTIVEEGVAAELDRTEQRRAIEVEADIAPDVPLADAVAELRRLAGATLPDGIEMLLEGEAATLNETSRELAITYAFAFIIVFLVLVAQFESLSSPFVVILTVPFGLAAAVYAMFATGVSLNIFSQVGLVMLIGLMAKNSILIVEFADQLRAEGQSLRDAVFNAATIRLRPIVMTLVSTVLGALPLIITAGAGAEARNSIGWVVFGGLGIAGLFTLFLTPALYLLLGRFGRARSERSQQLDRELAELDARDSASSDVAPAQ